MSTIFYPGRCEESLLKLVPLRERKGQLKLVPFRARKVQLKLVPLRERKGQLKLVMIVLVQKYKLSAKVLLELRSMFREFGQSSLLYLLRKKDPYLLTKRQRREFSSGKTNTR
ncbi:hypothetical protein GW17_00032221, partial [Ensete ventricosum]